MLSIPLPRVILERPFATFFVPMENNEENDNTIHSYPLSAHTMPSVVGIKELKVMGDVVFDLCWKSCATSTTLRPTSTVYIATRRN